MNSDTLVIKDSQGYSKCDEENFGLHGNIGSLRTTSNEMLKEKRRKRHSNHHTLVIKDSQGYSKCDEENSCLHGNIASLRTTSNEILKANSRKSHSNNHHTSEYA